MKRESFVPNSKDNKTYGEIELISRLMKVGVLLLDSAGNAVFASPLACELLGCDEEKKLEKRWGEIFPLLNIDLQASDISKPSRVTASVGGGRLVQVEVYPMNYDSCAGSLLLIWDPSVSNLFERELLLASRTRTMDYLQSGLAHDLRGPLNAMQIALELLGESVTPTVRNSLPENNNEAINQNRYVEILKEEFVRLNRALQGMLNQNFSLSEVSEIFDLRGLIREVSNLLAPQARRQRVSVDVQVPQVPIQVSAYREQIKQSLLNIAVNALQAMPDGGELRIECSVENKNAAISFQHAGAAMGNDVDFHVTRHVADAHGGEVRMVIDDQHRVFIRMTLPRV